MLIRAARLAAKASQYMRKYRFCNNSVYLEFTAVVAQLVEPQIVTLVVAGSSPVDRPPTLIINATAFHRGVCCFG